MSNLKSTIYKIKKEGKEYWVYRTRDSEFFLEVPIGIASTKIGAKHIIKKDGRKQLKKELKNEELIGTYNVYGEEINE